MPYRHLVLSFVAFAATLLLLGYYLYWRRAQVRCTVAFDAQDHVLFTLFVVTG